MKTRFWAPNSPTDSADDAITGLAVRSYAVSNDGQRFLIPSVAGGGTGPPITVVLNWQAGLKK